MASATTQVEDTVADLGDKTKCETSRGDCTREVEWYITIPCCGHQGPLCDLHAREGMDEWNSPAIVMGLFAYECGYCGADPMQRPTWREI